MSVISGAIATVLVWRLGTALYDESVGRNAAVLFMTFPGMPWLGGSSIPNASA